MFRRSQASLIRNTDCRVLSFFQRLRGLAYTQQLIRAIRVVGPTLVALSFAGVAHAKERWISPEHRRSWGRSRPSLFLQELSSVSAV
jgi:hypothetical protein